MAKEPKGPEPKPERGGESRQDSDDRRRGGFAEDHKPWREDRINKVTDWDKPQPPKKKD